MADRQLGRCVITIRSQEVGTIKHLAYQSRVHSRRRTHAIVVMLAGRTVCGKLVRKGAVSTA
jgi:hypothetical protein